MTHLEAIWRRTVEGPGNCRDHLVFLDLRAGEGGFVLRVAAHGQEMKIKSLAPHELSGV